jgi:hypothetical protein
MNECVRLVGCEHCGRDVCGGNRFVRARRPQSVEDAERLGAAAVTANLESVNT